MVRRKVNYGFILLQQINIRTSLQKIIKDISGKTTKKKKKTVTKSLCTISEVNFANEARSAQDLAKRSKLGSKN